MQRSGIQWDSDKLTVLDTTNESQEVNPFPAGESLKPNAINHWLVAVRSHLFHISDALKYFFPRTIPRWNSLAQSVVAAETTEEFRALIEMTQPEAFFSKF